MIIAGAAGVWLFYVQHQYEHTYWAREPAWTAEAAAIGGSSFYDLPRVVHWFTGNIGYHHIHHLSARVPNYHLRACFCGLLPAPGGASADVHVQPALRPAQAVGRGRRQDGRVPGPRPDHRWLSPAPGPRLARRPTCHAILRDPVPLPSGVRP